MFFYENLSKQASSTYFKMYSLDALLLCVRSACILKFPFITSFAKPTKFRRNNSFSNIFSTKFAVNHEFLAHHLLVPINQSVDHWRLNTKSESEVLVYAKSIRQIGCKKFVRNVWNHHPVSNFLVRNLMLAISFVCTKN